ncbi:hypothetical protein ACJJTC_018336 [Scirpophaga incertulas]
MNYKPFTKQPAPTTPTDRPVPSLDDADGLPKPKAMAKKQTPLTNDPLWLDALALDGETGFTNRETVKEFNANASGYLTRIIIIRCYGISSRSPRRRGVPSHDQDSLVRFVDGYPSAVMASGAATYLAGLGDFEDVSGVRHYLAAQEPGPDGTFGQVPAATHNLYKALPSPAVYVNRVLEDVAATRDRNRNPLWSLARIQPAQQALNAAANAAAAEPPHQARPRPVVDAEPEEVDPDLGAEEQEPPPEPEPVN